MTWWNPFSKPDDEANDPVDSGMKTYSVPADMLVNRSPKSYAEALVQASPGQIIPCDKPERARKVKTGYEWYEWIHGGKGVPWRVNTEEFNQMLMDGWEIVDICRLVHSAQEADFCPLSGHPEEG